MNLARGNVGAAGRHVLDFLGDIPDALLPGDLIPQATRPEDYTSGSDLLGIDKEAHPILGFAADVGLGTALDPLSWVGGAALKGVGNAAKAGLATVPKVAEALDKAGSMVRSVAGAQRLSPETRDLIQRARAANSNEKLAGFAQVKRALGGLSEPELNIVGDAIDNFKWQDGKLVGKLADDQLPAAQRVLLHPDVTPENAPRLQQAVEETLQLGRAQKARPNIFSDPNQLPDEYLMRQYGGMDDQAAEQLAIGKSSSIKGRTLPAQEDVMGFLNDPENTGVTYERNALKRATARTEQQGTLAQRAEIGKAILGPDYAHADDAMRSAVVDNISKLPPEEAQVVMDMYKGMKGRGAFEKVLAFNNGMFKKFAVYGAIIPKFGSIVRNKLSGIWQAAANPETRSVVGGQIKRLGSDLADATTQSLGLTNLKTGELSTHLETIDAAFQASGGSAEKAMSLLPPELADAVRYGVTDGYVSGEDLMKEMGRTGWKKGFDNAMNWPGKIFQGVESRMRLGAYLDLVKSGKMAPQSAASAVKDAFYDYAVSSKSNRLARDIIPFFQFQAKAIPQTAKLMAEKPWVAAAMSKALGHQSGPLYPWMEGKTNIPLGKDEQGNDQYATGLGLPFEAMNYLPGSFRDVKKNIVGSANPLIKSLFAATSGQDPYFETTYGSYDRIPGIGEAGDIGQLYNKAAQAGVIQPIDSLLRTIGGLTDERHSAGVKALDLLTGVNVASVDTNLALEKQLQDTLANNPDVMQHRSFYQKSKDQETQALLEAYKKAKATVKSKHQPH